MLTNEHDYNCHVCGRDLTWEQSYWFRRDVPYCDSCVRSQLGLPSNNFKTETCGTCAWYLMTKNCPEETFHKKCYLDPIEPACPAWEGRE